MAKKANGDGIEAGTPVKHTVTLTFGPDPSDIEVYEKLKTQAKDDRRDLNDYLVLQFIKANTST